MGGGEAGIMGGLGGWEGGLTGRQAEGQRSRPSVARSRAKDGRMGGLAC